MNEGLKLEVTEKRKLMKYAEGAIPGIDEPVEVIENSRVLTGAEAEQYLKQAGVSTNATN